MIDFGLSYSSTLVEDKAVDLYVLEVRRGMGQAWGTCFFPKWGVAWGRPTEHVCPRGGAFVTGPWLTHPCC